MTTGPGNPSLRQREQIFHYTPDDAEVFPIQRLAAALHDLYSLDRLLGHGGAAYVYLARDLRADRLVALKVLRPEFSAAIAQARFHREVEIALRLRHPNILPL